MYEFIKKVKNVFVPQEATKLEEVSIQPGDIVLAYKDGKPYGVCGAVYATQVDLSRQIEFKKTYLITN